MVNKKNSYFALVILGFASLLFSCKPCAFTYKYYSEPAAVSLIYPGSGCEGSGNCKNIDIITVRGNSRDTVCAEQIENEDKIFTTDCVARVPLYELFQNRVDFGDSSGNLLPKAYIIVDNKALNRKDTLFGIEEYYAGPCEKIAYKIKINNKEYAIEEYSIIYLD